MPRRFFKAHQDRGAERRKKDLALGAQSAFALVGVLFGLTSAPNAGSAQTLNPSVLGAAASAVSNLCYNPADPGQCYAAQSAHSGSVTANFTAPVTGAFPPGTGNIGTAAAGASLLASGTPGLANTAELTATATASSFYVSATGEASVEGSFEVKPPQNGNNNGQLAPIEVIGSGDAVATGSGWSYSDLEVSGFGPNGTFPIVEAQAQTNYSTPYSPNEGPTFSIDQTIMLEPNTVGLVQLDADAFAGQQPYDLFPASPFAAGCPTYCGTASSDLDPLIEISPAFLAANPGYSLVFSPGFVPPPSSAVPELSTWVMLAIGFAGLALAGWGRRANATNAPGPLGQIPLTNDGRLGGKLPFGRGYAGWRRGRRMAAA